MDETIFNCKVCVILFNKPSSQIIYNYLNKDKNKFKQVINNKLSLLMNKYKLFTSNLKNPFNPRFPGENSNNITYIKKYIIYLNTIINNNYNIPENEINIIISILNQSIDIFIDKLKMKTIDFSKNMLFYKNNYNNNCWLNHFIQILGCQPVFTKHFKKYIKNAYINFNENSKIELNIDKMDITLPEYNYIFNKIPLYNYDILQNILETASNGFIEFNKYSILPEDIEINIIDPYYLLPVYNNRKIYKFDQNGFCFNDCNFVRIFNISKVLLNGSFYFIRKSKNNTKYIIQVDDIKSKKLLADIINIYICVVYNNFYYLIENNESLSYYTLIVNTQQDINNKNNYININSISNLFFNNTLFNNMKYAYCKMNDYLSFNSIYTPFNGTNISHSFLSLSSIINKHIKNKNDILYIVSYNIIKIFKETIYNNKINILREPLFYVFDLFNEYSNYNIPLYQTLELPNKLNKSTSLNNLIDKFEKINIRNKSQSYNNIKKINDNNLNLIHTFLLDSKFYNLFNT